eukprot:2755655-Heterocapsa_arctica.AAC.1
MAPGVLANAGTAEIVTARERVARLALATALFEQGPQNAPSSRLRAPPSPKHLDGVVNLLLRAEGNFLLRTLQTTLVVPLDRLGATTTTLLPAADLAVPPARRSPGPGAEVLPPADFDQVSPQ